MTAEAPNAPSHHTARADTMAVHELLREMADGRLVNPSFQRGWRWRDADQIKLLESVLSGIPIGVVLLSDPFVDAPPSTKGERFVLDGQQRLRTLRELVTPPAEGARALHLDTATRTFRFAQAEPLDVESALVPVGLLGDPDALLDALMGPPVPRATLTAALDVSRRLREYRVPIYHLAGVTEAAARQMAVQVNNVGRRPRRFEFFNALHADGRDVPSTAQVVDELEPLGFGRLPEEEVTKVIAVLTGHDPGRDAHAIAPSETPDALTRTRAALSRAIRFLREEADVPHLQALPYVLPLLVLSRLFDAHPEVSPRSRILLRRWVWRGAATGAHHGARASLREAVQAVAQDEHATVQALLRQVPRDPSQFAWSPDMPVRSRHAVDRVVLCALAARRPVDLRDGRPLDVGALIEAHAIVPAVSAHDHGRSWATSLLHPRMRRTDLVRRIVVAPPEALASHVIGAEARDALAAAENGRFAAARGVDLAERVRRFLTAHAEWTASDHPALSSYSEVA